MLDKSILGCLIIIRCYDKECVRSGGLCLVGQLYGNGRVVGARTGNDRNAVVDLLDGKFNGLDVFYHVEGSTLAGGAADDDGVGAVGNLIFNELSELRIVDVSVLVERCNDGDGSAGENWLIQFHFRFFLSQSK